MATGRVKKEYDDKGKGVKLMVEGQEGYVQVRNAAVGSFPSGCIVQYELTGEAWGKTLGCSSCKIVDSTPAGKAADPAGAAAAGAYEEKDAQRQLSIITQHSQEHALTLIENLLKHGALTLPEKPAGKLDVYVKVYNKLVDDLTAQALRKPAAQPPAAAPAKKQPPKAEAPTEEGFEDEIPL